MMALVGFRKAGVADLLAAAREVAAKTRARQFDSRQAAMFEAVQSFDWLIRASGAISASQSKSAADSGRDGARKTAIKGMVNGRVNVTVAMMERDFTVCGDIVKRDEGGALWLDAFEPSHETYG